MAGLTGREECPQGQGRLAGAFPWRLLVLTCVLKCRDGFKVLKCNYANISVCIQDFLSHDGACLKLSHLPLLKWDRLGSRPSW